jgi:hypothetical protein
MEETQPLAPPSGDPKRPKKNRSFPYVLATLLVILGALLIYTFTQKETIQADNNKLEKQNDDLKAELEQLDLKVEELDRALGQAQLDNEEKREMVKKLNEEIVYLKVRLQKAIDEGTLDKRLKEEYEGKYRQLAYYNEKYREKLEDVLRQKEGRITELTAGMDSLQTLTYTLEGQNIVQREKLKVASMLKAGGVQTYSINSRGKEELGPQLKQRRMRGFKGCLTLVKNDVAEVGLKTLYMLLYGPDGKIYHTPSMGSGYFSTTDGEKAYTAKQSFQYKREETEVCVTYNLPDVLELQRGNNTVLWMLRRDGEEDYYYVVEKQVIHVK